MDKKKIIQIVVIVIAFMGSGFVLYNGLFKDSMTSSSGDTELAQDPGLAQEEILPFGSTADFGILKRQNLFYNQVGYPKLDSKNDYGVLKENLMLSPPSK